LCEALTEVYENQLSSVLGFSSTYVIGRTKDVMM